MEIETYVTVNVDLNEFETEDLVEELEGRGKYICNEDGHHSQLAEIWQLRRTGRPFDTELDNYIYEVLGKII